MNRKRDRPAPRLAAVIRRAIEESGESAYAVAKGSGVSQAVLSRFLSGSRGLTLETADRLCHHLGLELVRRSPPITPASR